MNTRVKDITGQAFGRLIVVSYAGKAKPKGSQWLCKCECGTEKEIRGNSLKTGKVKSCGCGVSHLIGDFARKHGDYLTKEYSSWEHMRSRCNNKNSRGYKNYGGRGIKICERWNSFENFLADMGRMPHSKMSIERNDVNGDYSPDNCRWATLLEQARNTRRVINITYKGITMCRTAWSNFLNIPTNTLIHRIKIGQSVEQTFEIINHTASDYVIQSRHLLKAISHGTKVSKC